MTLADRIAAACDGVVPSGPVVAALGGGADSAAAAWGCRQAGRSLVGVFVDHRLEGSRRLRDAAERLTRRLDIELQVVPAPCADGPGLELRARELRRDALSAVAGGRPIVVGHTADDQAETVLMHLLRGAGTRGAAGMRTVDPPWYRPLLDVTRDDTRALADGLALPYADDPANADLRFTRNRIRRIGLPSLVAAMGDRDVVGALGAAARRFRDVDALLGTLADEVPVRRDAGATLLPAPVLASVARPVATYAVWRALRGPAGPQGGSAADVAAVMAVVDGARRRQLGGGLLAEREGPYVAIHAGPVPAPDPIADVPVPGRVRFGAITVEIAPGEGSGGLAPSLADGRLSLRAPEPGDRIDIAGGRKRVVEALAEAAVPVRLRSAWPLLVADGAVAAIPGVRLASWAASRQDGALRLEIERGP